MTKRLLSMITMGIFFLTLFVGANKLEAKDKMTTIGSIKPKAINIDGSLKDWKDVKQVIKLNTVDAGVGEQITLDRRDKFKINSFKLAWDGEELFISYDIMDKNIVWSGQNWWEGTGFEVFLCGNTAYRKDMAELKKDEMEAGKNTCIQYYMAGPHNSGFFGDRTADSAIKQFNKVRTKTIVSKNGYTGEIMLPLGIIPELREQMISGKAVSLAVRLRTVGDDGITLSVSNVAIPVETNKLRPIAMQKVVFQKIQGVKATITGNKNNGNIEGEVPIKPTNFRTIAWDGSVSISWNNTPAPFKEVHIVRSTNNYPETPGDGVTVYKGNGSSYMDNMLKKDSIRYYYSIFTYNSDNKYSDPSKSSAVPAEIPQKPDKAYPIMHDFIGTHAFIDDDMNRISVAGAIREYHPWEWDESSLSDYKGYPDNLDKFNPSYGGNGWDFDKFYKTLKDKDITVVPAFQYTMPWVNSNYYSQHENKPVPQGKSTTDPMSYIAHAGHLFQFAARYGSQTVSDKLLKLASDQRRVSGLGYVKYMENWNEPDKDWDGKDAQFSPEELAAMLSADYDGNLGKMGNSVGVKNADPNMKLVMGGLYMPRTSFIQAMIDWAKMNRNGSFPADVLNFHYYATDGLKGLYPEDDGMQAKMERLNAFRELNLPDKELWLTEFGYDTYKQSKYSAPNELMQAQWILRAYLETAASGLDRAFQYMMRNVSDTSVTNYDTSGLVSSKDTKEVPKISWYYVYTMRNCLNNMFYDTRIASGKNNVSIMRFRDNNTYKGAYVLWCPTGNGQTVKNYELDLMKDVKSAEVVVPIKGKTSGEVKKLSIKDGKVKINVSETPVFVLFE